MKGFLIACAVLVAIIGVAIMSVAGIWNTLNAHQQSVKAGKSHYGSALDICSQKIGGVWQIANQYMEHESETFQKTAEARNGYLAAAKAFEEAAKAGADTKALTAHGAQAIQAALAFQVQVEAYPNLKASETTRDNMRNLQESVNEIKTALDDWIFAIKGYNTYRGRALVSLVASFFAKYPSEYEYYEGKATELDVSKLNPGAPH